MQTRSKKVTHEYARSVDDSINDNHRHTKKRKITHEQQPSSTTEAAFNPVLDPQDDNVDSSVLSLKPSGDVTFDIAAEPLPAVLSYQQKFGLFVQSFLKVQDEYNSIIDLIQTTVERASELKVRVNNLSFLFNFSPASENENVAQKRRRRDRVLYELRDIQTLSNHMQNDYSCLKQRLKNRYLVVLDEFCTNFKEWEEKYNAGGSTHSIVL